MAVGHAMKGMLAGGVNQNLEDSAAKAYCQDQPAAKCYVDNSESYSTNEITIYWNSPLTYLLSLTENTGSGEQGDVTTTTTTETTTTTTTAATTTTSSATSADEEASLYGDANCDGEVDLSDAVMIMQSLANPDKYGVNGSDERHITKQGLANADVRDRGDGVTTGDAQAIQAFMLHSITSLPQ